MPAAAADARSKRCPRSGLEAKSSKAVLYEVGDDDGNHELVGCVKKSRKRTTLATWFSCDCSIGDDAPPQAWLSGRMAAVNGFSCSPIDPNQPCSGTLEVTDLRSRATLH